MELFYGNVDGIILAGLLYIVLPVITLFTIGCVLGYHIGKRN